MAAPDLTQRTTVFIAKIGTDDAGYNVVGAPQPRLTIAQALADLASMYNAATPAAPKTIAMEPGTYTTPAFALPPNVFIEADPDAEGGSNAECIILLTGNITLSSGWTSNTAAVGGFRGVTIRQEAGAIDLTMPTPVAGNPARVVYLENVRTDTPSLSWEATSTADALRVTDVIYDGAAGSAIEFSAGTQQVNGLQSNCPVTFNDTAAIDAAVNVYGLFIVAAPSAVAPGVTFASSTGGLTARMGASDVRALTLNRAGAAAITVYADAVSIPLVANRTFSGTAVNADLVRTTDSTAISGGGAVSSVTGTAFEATASPATGAVIIGYSAISRIATSLAIGGATIGTNALAVNGTISGNGSNITNVPMAFPVATSAKSANFTVTAADRATLFQVTTGSGSQITATLPAAATAGLGWFCFLQKVDSTNRSIITSPATNIVNAQYQVTMIWTDGTSYYSVPWSGGTTGGFGLTVYGNQQFGTSKLTIDPDSGSLTMNGGTLLIGNGTSFVAPVTDLAAGAGTNVKRLLNVWLGSAGLKIGNGTNPATITTSTDSAGANLVLTPDGSGIVSIPSALSVAGLITASAGLTLPVAQKVTIASGTNQRAFDCLLVAGTVTVNNTTVTANTRAQITRKVDGGTISADVTYTLSAATSITITAALNTDTSTFSVFLYEVV